MAFAADGGIPGAGGRVAGATTPPAGGARDASSYVDDALGGSGTATSGGDGDVWSTFGKRSYDGPPVIIIPGHDRTRHVDPRDREAGVITTPESHVTAGTPDEAYRMWYEMDDGARTQLQQMMWGLGLTKGPEDIDGAFKAWQQAVDTAFQFTAAGNPKSVMDTLPMLANFGMAGGKGSKGPTTSRSTTFDVLDPLQAKVALHNAFQQMMGRNPTDAEMSSWISSAQSAMKAHPRVSETTVDANGNQTTKTVDPGYDPQAAIQDQLNNDPEAQAHQAAATLYPALLQALRSPV